MRTILILEPDGYSPKALKIYRSLGPVFLYPQLKGKKLWDVLKQTNIVVVRLRYKLDESWFDNIPNLKIIATPTTGLNHIDLDEAKKRGIKIVSLRGHASFLKDIPSTAEETMALLLALMRNIPWAFEDVKKGNWNRDAWKGHQLIHKTLGLVGVGRLGKITAKYAKTFGLRVIGYDPNVDEKTMRRYGVEKAGMNTVFKESDVVSLHVLLNPDTYNLVQEKHLRMMKPTSYLINTARAELIEKKALIKALKQKWIAGAALDVLWDEAGAGSHLKRDPLWDYARKHSNLLIVPHIGGATYEAMHLTEEFIAEQVAKMTGSFLKEKPKR